MSFIDRLGMVSAAALIAASLSLPPARAASEADASAQQYKAEADKLLAKNDFKGAVIEMKNAVKAAPDNPQMRLDLATLELRLNDIDGATIELKAAREHGADEVKVVPLLAQTYLMQRKFEDLLTDMPARDDGTPELRAYILTARGDAQLQLNKVDDAKTSFATAEQLMPQAVGPKLGLARIAMVRKQTDDALAKANEILKIAPRADAHVLKGTILVQKGDKDGALAELDEAIKLDPNSLTAYLERAQIHLVRNEDDKAEADVKVVLASAPRSLAANYYEALLLARRKDFNGADDILTKYSGMFSDFPQGFYLQAVVKSTLKQFEQAQTAIGAYLARVPDDAVGQKVQGEILLRKGDAANAVPELENVVAQRPDDFQALILLGQAYMQSGRPQQALDTFEKAAKLAPDDPAVLRGLALNHLNTGASAAGTAELEKVLQITPDDEPSTEALFLVYLRSHAYDKAKKLVDDMHQRRPNDPIPVNMNGMLEVAQGHMIEAEAAYKAAIQQFPDFTPARMTLAQLYQAQGKLDDARALYQAILDKEPANLETLKKISEVLQAQGKPDDVIAICQKAHVAAPDDVQVAIGLIEAYEIKKDWNGGLQVVREMQLRAPNDASLYLIRSQLQFNNGMPKDAVASLQRLTELRPDDISVWRALAFMQEKAGDLPAAIDTIKEARKRDPKKVELVVDEVRLLGERNQEDGIAAARAAAAERPDEPSLQILEGDYLQKIKRPEDAKAAYENNFKAHPSLVLVERLSNMAMAAGKPADAGKLMTDWETAHPTDEAAKLDVANYMLQAKQYAQAQTRYEALLKTHPSDPTVLNNLAWLYEHNGDSRALDLARRAYNEAPRVPAFADTLGWIIVHQGDLPNGLKLLQQARVGAPEDPEVLYHVAYALDRSGNKAEAATTLKKAMASGQDFDSKKDAEALMAELSKS